DDIRGWVIGGPASQGLDRANWTYEELADHLKKTHGITTSRSAMHRFCSKIGIRPHRPTYRYLRPGQAVKLAHLVHLSAVADGVVDGGLAQRMDANASAAEPVGVDAGGPAILLHQPPRRLAVQVPPHERSPVGTELPKQRPLPILRNSCS